MKRDFQNIALILLISFIGFWQIATFQNILKWDFVDITMPWRFFIGENIQNGYIPLWSVYSKLGFPQYFDPQTWYPITWLISLTVGYNVYTIQLEFVFHIFMAGIGMYYLSQHFTSDKKIRLTVSVIFLLSGFFIGNAQHMGWIVSAAWIPFILNSYLNIYKTKSYISSVSFIIFITLLFTGGYFPFFITTIYILIGIFVIKIVTFLKAKNLKKIKKIVLKHFLIVPVFIAINLVTILSLIEAKGFIGRGEGLSLPETLEQSLGFSSMLTFVFPFATMWKNNDFWEADITVINNYFGLIPFLLIIFGIIFIKKSKSQILLIILGILSFMIAMGNIFPIRKYLYYILPYFNYFRFPSLFRYFGIISFSLVSALFLKSFLEFKNFKLIRKFLLAITVIFIVIVLYAFIRSEATNIKLYSWYEVIKDISLLGTIKIQGLIHLIILISSCLVLFLIKNNKKKLIFLIVIIVFDLIISAQLNAPKTIYSKNNAIKLQNDLTKLPNGFPLPDIQEKIININEKGKGISPLWRNMNYYYKKTAYDGYGPYQLNNFTKFERSGFFEDLLKNPILYFGTNFSKISGTLDSSFIINHAEGIVLSDLTDQKHQKLKMDSTDFSNIRIIKFNPKEIESQIEISKDGFLVFMQNYKPNWSAKIDNKETKIYNVNYSLQGIIVPKGKHIVNFKFVNRKIVNSFYFSSFSFIAVLIFIVYLLFRKRYKTNAEKR